MRVLVVVLLLSAFAAHAVAKGGSLFIKSKGVKLLKQPKAGSMPASRELALGTEVKWLGASASDKAFHEIEVDGKRGFVLMSNLSPARPQPELTEPLGAQSFASSDHVGCEFGPSRKPYLSAAAKVIGCTSKRSTPHCARSDEISLAPLGERVRERGRRQFREARP
jgi:hypothetical protein